MTIASFSVPVDVPWRRIAFSTDMMDRQACDRSHPLRWRSSIAVFEYQPPADQQEIGDTLISYLKVSCSITGYQPNGAEIQIRDRLGRSGWAARDMGNLKDAAGKLVDEYYPCYGALLEVVVAPPVPTGIPYSQYPYIVDFDPKKREMYEQVTTTGETMSRSLDDVGVKKGKTTTQSHEVKDKVSVGAEAGSSGLGGKLSAGYESTTTDLNSNSAENIRTTDAQREGRENLSHTTQVSQLYQLLNSYHLGTNRAAFYVLPRPHTIGGGIEDTDPTQKIRTFVNGPREIEGIQEFMLIVARPADQDDYCVEAYLETAHLVRTPIAAAADTTTAPLTLDDSSFGSPVISRATDGDWQYIVWTTTATVTVATPVGYEIDMGRSGAGSAFGGAPGYRIDSLNRDPQNPSDDEKFRFVKLDWDVAPDHVTLTATVVRSFAIHWVQTRQLNASVQLNATIYLKSKNPAQPVDFTDQLLLTGRAVCSCDPLDMVVIPAGGAGARDLSITYEKPLASPASLGGRERPELSIRDANRFSASIRHEMVQSITSPDRYPRGAVDLIDTQLFANTLSAHLQTTPDAPNPRLSSWAADGSDIARRVARYAPRLTRADLLRVPLPEQVQRFGLSFDEALTLRRALADLPVPDRPPPIPEPRRIAVPQLTGRYLEQARAAIADADLDVGAVAEADNPLAARMVITQEPAAGTQVDAGTGVSLTVSSGLSVIVPNLDGLPLAEAMCTLLRAGFRGDPVVAGPTGPDARVAEVEPQPGTPITPNAPVTVRLRTARERREPPVQ
jgi:hypothetical protein